MFKVALLLLVSTSTLWGMGPISDYDFEGIVKMSNCSASIITFSGMPSHKKAIMMTNGHCTSRLGRFIPPNQAILNKNINLRAQVYDTNKKLHPIRATKLLYATMTQTDLAFYELNTSYDFLLEKFNVRPLLLDHNPATKNLEVQIVSGYWDKGFTCQINEIVSILKESNWSFSESIRFQQDQDCNMNSGTSGAPITLKNSRLVIGINNTSNVKGKSCSSNNPCEIEGNQIIVRKGVRYGQQTYKIYACLTPDFSFDFSNPNCELPR